ncbi:hypothetical protein [Plantactinospora mayteni]|nr:hypothetical protein [Plantactinospora mayteni]
MTSASALATDLARQTCLVDGEWTAGGAGAYFTVKHLRWPA